MAEKENILIIQPEIDHSRYLKELFTYRELFYFFAWRDILVRYKQAFFGVAWAIIRPLLSMLIFTVLFSHIAAFPSEGVPYSLFTLAGMVAWGFFSNCISETTTSLLNNPALITRIYFPRMILPGSMILVQGVDFIIGFAMMLLYGLFVGGFDFRTFILLPIPLFLLLLFSFGFSLIVSSLTVRFRDVRYIVPFLVQIGLYASPVAYGTLIIPDRWQLLYSLNPLVGILELFRFSLFGVATSYLPLQVLVSVIGTFFMLSGGFVLFRTLEPTFGDDI